MASSKVKLLSDDKIEILINLWHMEPSLWDTADSAYSNANLRKAALRRMSEKMDGLPTGKVIDSTTKNFGLYCRAVPVAEEIFLRAKKFIFVITG